MRMTFNVSMFWPLCDFRLEIFAVNSKGRSETVIIPEVQIKSLYMCHCHHHHRHRDHHGSFRFLLLLLFVKNCGCYSCVSLIHSFYCCFPIIWLFFCSSWLLLEFPPCSSMFSPCPHSNFLLCLQCCNYTSSLSSLFAIFVFSNFIHHGCCHYCCLFLFILVAFRILAVSTMLQLHIIIIIITIPVI